MIKEQLIQELERIYTFFSNTIECLEEEDSNFTPAEGIFTTAQQIAHAAISIDWFIEGAFVADHFDMDFEKQDVKVKQTTSINTAKEWFKKSIDNAKSIIALMSDEELLAPLPEGPVMGGAPRMAVIGGLADHTAHHRGALAVYARLHGKVPKMPYGGE